MLENIGVVCSRGRLNLHGGAVRWCVAEGMVKLAWRSCEVVCSRGDG